MILEVCAKKINGKKITKVPEILHATFTSIFLDEEFEWKWPKPLEIIREPITEEQRAGMVSLGLDPNIYSKGQRYDRVEMVETYVKSLVEYYNKMPGVVHERTGNKKGNEGTEVSASLASLNAINEFLALREKLSSNPANAADEKLNFVKRALAANGDLVNGMRKLFLTGEETSKKTKIAQVREMFGLPGDVQENDLRFTPEVCEKFFSEMEGKASNTSLLGGLVEAYFDFPRNQCPKDAKRRRDIVMETEGLTLAASQCLSMTFAAFPELNKSKGNISREFLNKTIENQGWTKDITSVSDHTVIWEVEIAPKETFKGSRDRTDMLGAVMDNISINEMTEINTLQDHREKATSNKRLKTEQYGTERELSTAALGNLKPPARISEEGISSMFTGVRTRF